MSHPKLELWLGRNQDQHVEIYVEGRYLTKPGFLFSASENEKCYVIEIIYGPDVDPSEWKFQDRLKRHFFRIIKKDSSSKYYFDDNSNPGPECFDTSMRNVEAIKSFFC